MGRTMGRFRHYLEGIARNLRPGYQLAYLVSHLLPAHTAGPIIARLYRISGGSVGAGSSFMGPVRVLGPAKSMANLVVGERVVLGSHVTINVDDRVSIGDGVSIGPFVRIYTATHSIGPGSRRMMPQVVGKPVTIGAGAWLGLGTVVLPGVTIGPGCVVAAGSVVMTDVDPNTYAEGNPAKVVRPLPWGDR